MRRSILRCADCIILSCSFGGCPCSRCVALRRSYCCVEQSETVFGQVVFRCQFLPVFGERLPSSGWPEVWARLSPQLPITSFINLADGSNSAFAANVHRLLGRRCRLCAPRPYSSHLRRQCPTLPWSSMTALSVKFLWLLHCTLFHKGQHVDGLQSHLARSSYAANAASAVPDSTCIHLDVVICCVLRADCAATRHDRVDRTEVSKHRNVLKHFLLPC